MVPVIELAFTLYVIAGLLVLAIVAIACHPRTAGGSEGPDDEDGGGGNQRQFPPDRPWGSPNDSEPAWWPEFEREFAAYVNRAPTAA